MFNVIEKETTHLLLNGRILIDLVIKERMLIASIVNGPFQEMIGQIEAPIIVRAIFVIDDHQVGITDVRIGLRISAKHRIASTIKITVILVAAKGSFSTKKNLY